MVNLGGLHRAIAKGRLGDVKEAIGHLTYSLGACQAIGAEIASSYFLGELAEIYREAGRVGKALNTVKKAIDHAQGHGELCYESALYRIRGELLALEGKGTAETDLSRAVEIAREQGAKLLELQGTIKLHALCRDKGRPEPSRTNLRTVYESFAQDALDLPDLKEARMLLAQSPSAS